MVTIDKKGMHHSSRNGEYTNKPGANASFDLGVFVKGSLEQYLANEENLINTFPADSQGYFGVALKRKTKSKTTVRRFVSNDPVETAEKFWDILSYNGDIRLMDSIGEHKIAEFANGDVVIGYRKVSKSDGSPVVHIWIETPFATLAPDQKLHFIH